MLIELYITQSSAYNRILEIIFSGKSLMYNKNNSGPSTDPCGTPDDTLTVSDEQELKETYCVRLERKLDIQSTSNGFLSIALSLQRSLLWRTVSKALERSINKASICEPVSRELAMSCVNSTSCEMVLTRAETHAEICTRYC